MCSDVILRKHMWPRKTHREYVVVHTSLSAKVAKKKKEAENVSNRIIHRLIHTLVNKNKYKKSKKKKIIDTNIYNNYGLYTICSISKSNFYNSK